MSPQPGHGWRARLHEAIRAIRTGGLSLRVQEGALSAKRTPTKPPAPTALVPMSDWKPEGHDG